MVDMIFFTFLCVVVCRFSFFEYSGQEIDRAVNVFEIQFDGY